MSRSDVLVDADWAEAHIGDPGVVIVEVDEDTSAYDKGHIPTAIKLDWKKDLQDPVRRDFVDKTGFEALLSGHIPTARNVPCSKAANEDGTFRPDDALRSLYQGEAGLDFGRDTIAYCRIGERSAHTWFVLHELLGLPNVKNYDGSWTEYGSLVGVPIELGEAR